MHQYLDSIRTSLATNNHFGAIAMALTLPDICASVDDEYSKTSRNKYCQWFDKYLANTYKIFFRNEGVVNVIFGASECYAARCSFLHQGTNIIKHQEIALKDVEDPAMSVNFMSFGMKYMRNGDVLTLDVNFFCENMITAVEKWMIDIKGDKIKCAKISSMPIIHESFESLCVINRPTN